MNLRPVFSVIIEEQEFDVWHLEKEHEGWNGEPKNWWIYFSDRMPDGFTPPEDSPYFIPYSKSILRRCWDIKIKQHTYTKDKWGSTEFRNSTHVEMWCNRKLVYSFVTSGSDWGLSFAFSKIQYLQTMLSEHPYDFFDPLKENGRKIFWYGLPATVKVKSETWCIGVIPDYSSISKEFWWKEYRRRISKIGYVDPDDAEWDQEDADEAFRDDYINWGDALSDKHIDWFRQDPPKETPGGGSELTALPVK